MDYKQYLTSPEWQVLRRLKLAEADGRCQVCNGGGVLHVHHRSYERLGREILTDLTVLCADCHNLFHDKQPF
jgi:5-methylcytosine-specific restriction endonuclease McrA